MHPRREIGAINLPLSVSQSVSLSVRDAKLQELAPRIFLLFCMKLVEFIFCTDIPFYPISRLAGLAVFGRIHVLCILQSLRVIFFLSGVGFVE